MIYYLKIIFLLIVFNSIILKIFFIALLGCGIKFMIDIKRNYIMTIDKMKVNSIFDFILISILFFVLYIVLFTYRRYLNISRTLDLKLLIYNTNIFFKESSIFNNVLLIICMIFLIIFVFYFSTLIRKYLFFHFLKLHIFIIYHTQKENYYEETSYEKLIEILIKIENFLYEIIIEKPLSLLYKLYLKYDPEHEHKNKYFLIFLPSRLNIPKHEERFPIYLVTASFLYDTIYNNMVLSKTYYILLLLFLYYLFSKTISLMCFMYRGDCLKIYKYLYEEKELILPEQIFFKDGTVLEQEEIKHLNDELLRADNYGKAKYHLGYEKQLFIKINRYTYIWIINIVMILHIIYVRNIQIYFLQQEINNHSIAFIILSVLTICWIFINKSTIRYLLELITILITLAWLLVIINHFVPLLFHEILIDNSYIKIVDNYTLKEKLYFIKEYLQYQSSKFNLNNTAYLLKMLENISLQNLIDSHNIEKLKNYVDNIIAISKRLDTCNSNAIDSITNKTIFDIKKEYDSYYFVKICYFVHKIKNMFIPYFPRKNRRERGN